MKKVAIITVYKNINYGSVLQTYALQRILKIMNCYSETVQFLPNSIPNAKNNSLFKRLFSVIQHPSQLFKRLVCSKNSQRHIKFKLFLKEFINETRGTYYNNKELMVISDDYDAFISGSDQIWSPGQFNRAFFLDFCKDNRKKIAYAPSIGMNQIPESLKKEYAYLISRYSYVSVRENQGANMIEELVGFKPTVVLDPTLLICPNEWMEISKKMNIGEPYILCYFLGDNREHRRIVSEIKKKTGYSIIIISFVLQDYFYGDKRVYNVDPREFIDLIKNAALICTDSFHGTIFSINFNKNFYTFLRFKNDDLKNQNSRVIDILNKFGLLDDQHFDSDVKKIDYSEINVILDFERKKSINYIESALKSIDE